MREVFVRRPRRTKEANEEEQGPFDFTVAECRVVLNPKLVRDDNNFREEELVSEVDQWLSHASHWLPFCVRFDYLLDPNSVCAGLQKTLAHIPALGARFDATTNKKLYRIVLSTNNHGVPVEIVYGKRTKMTESHPTPPLPDESTPRTTWQKHGLNAPGPGFTGAPGRNDPLLRVRLILFPDEEVSYLAIGISHGLGDGHTIADILQTWSHFCSSNTVDDASSSSFTRPLGHRVTQPHRPAPSVAALRQRIPTDVGCTVNPLSTWAFFFHLLPRAIWSISRQRVLEVRVHADRIATWKDSLTLPPGTAWVSRFELVMGALLLAQRVTADRSSSNKASTSPEHHKLFVACNLRGRVQRFPKNYFGNAAFDFCETMQLDKTTMWNESSLAAYAAQVHGAVRKGLSAKGDDLCKCKDWFEAARHLGLTNQYDVWPIVFDTFRGTGTFVNSWGPRWLEISMGGQEQQGARCMAPYFGVAENLLVEVPRSRESGDTTIQLALPKPHAARFVEFCAEQSQKDPHKFPFSIIE